MTEYFAVCKCGKIIKEPTSWKSINKKIVRLGLYLNGIVIAEIIIPDKVESLIQCKLATIVGGLTSNTVHIIGYNDGIQHVNAFDFNTGKSIDFPIEQLNLIPHSIKQ